MSEAGGAKGGNPLVYGVEKDAEVSSIGFVVKKFWCGRITTRYYLFHPALRGKKCENVRVIPNKKNTAWIVLPRGDRDLIFLDGRYASRGKWAPKYEGHYVAKVLEEAKQYLVEEKYWVSRGGGLAHTTYIFAIPHATRIPLAVIKRTISDESVEERALFSDGTEMARELWETVKELPEEAVKALGEAEKESG